jgi:hypothetical protein
MKSIMTTHTLKTTLSILCCVGFLNGCTTTPEVSVEEPPKKPTMERLTDFPPRTQAQRVTQQKSEENEPSMKQLQTMYLDYLKKEGYPPEIDSDGDVRFKRQGITYFIDVRSQQKDPKYFRIILPGFWSIDNETEKLMVLIAADQINSTVKVVKIYTVKDHTWAAVEIFVPKPEDFKKIFPRSMSALSGGVELFAKTMRELRKQKI